MGCRIRKLTAKQIAAFGLDGDRPPKACQGVPLAPAGKKADPLFDAVCLAHGIEPPKHEVQFIPGRKFLADHLFAGWLIVEKDGGLFGRGKPCPVCKRRPPGAHSSIGQMKSDREKDRLAVLHGFAVLRFFPDEFEDGSAFAFIKQVLEGRTEEMP